MTIRLNQVPLTSTAATLVVQQVAAQGANLIFTNSSQTIEVYLGFGTGVTVNNGAVIPPYAVIPFQNVVGTTAIYGIAASGTIPVGIFYGDLS